MKGQAILDTITSASLFRVECGNGCECGSLIIWSSGSAEQLEAIFEQQAKPEMSEMAFLIRRLARVVRKTDPENDIATKALAYLHKIGLGPNPLRGDP